MKHGRVVKVNSLLKFVSVFVVILWASLAETLTPVNGSVLSIFSSLKLKQKLSVSPEYLFVFLFRFFKGKLQIS